MRHFSMRALAGVCLLAGALAGANNREVRSAGEHVIALVPLIGAGTLDDPMRPMFAPKPGEASAALAQGQAPAVLAYHFVIADDGKTAIVEYVAPSRRALQPILDAASAGTVTVYEPRRASLRTTLFELKRAKANFDWEAFRGVPKAPVNAPVIEVAGGVN